MFHVTSNEGFRSSFREETIADGIMLLHLEAVAEDKPGKLDLKLEWETDDIDVNVCFSPMEYAQKRVRPNWGKFSTSSAMSSAPLFSNIAYDDSNRLTIACSDAKNSVKIRSGVIEETARLQNTVRINVDCGIDRYTSDVRIDTRQIPFWKCVEDSVKWWESYEGYEPTAVPETARCPLYSAWYSFHQKIDIPKILEECRYFAALGCRSIIVDDGWQTEDNSRGYSYCGDWQPTPAKIPDMKAFVDGVHETGMKFILWFSVPFVGIHSKAYRRFQDKMLSGDGRIFVLDPRYPEVRDYLITIYRNAATEWGLDGFKLDFIDSFHQSEEVKDGMDYVSVYDAVDRLMKDVRKTLTQINPEVLIEFRQSYIGPLMRTFGNMLRSEDCPNDSFSNRQNTLALRMISGNTAVHSDMVMWNSGESAEHAAYQLTHTLFSVPQISVRHDKIPESHAKMVKNYLDFWMKYRSVLLDGEMFYQNYAANFTYVSSRKDETQVGAVYGGRIARIEHPTEEIVVVNASSDKEVILESAGAQRPYQYTVTDCFGEEVSGGACLLGENLVRISVPINGVVTLIHKN